MRYFGAVRGTGRFASEDIVYKDVLFPKGTFIAPSMATANRDPGRVRRPGTFDITREPSGQPQLTFGSGHPLLPRRRAGPRRAAGGAAAAGPPDARPAHRRRGRRGSRTRSASSAPSTCPWRSRPGTERPAAAGSGCVPFDIQKSLRAFCTLTYQMMLPMSGSRNHRPSSRRFRALAAVALVHLLDLVGDREHQHRQHEIARTTVQAAPEAVAVVPLQLLARPVAPHVDPDAERHDRRAGSPCPTPW